jgi:hypothetical protein
LPVPTITWLPTTTGAEVRKYCWLKGAISLCQRSRPVRASSEIR